MYSKYKPKLGVAKNTNYHPKRQQRKPPTMLPRKSAVTKYLGGVVLVVAMWLFLSSFNQVAQDVTDWQTGVLEDISRDFTPVISNKTAAGHLTLNVSDAHNGIDKALEKLAQNETLHIANKTVLRDLVRHVNNTVNLNYTNEVITNPHPFSYLLNSKNMCRGKDVFLIIYIHTAPKHYKRRAVIRQTWGNQRFYKDLIIKLIFVMGMTEDVAIQSGLEFESEQYGDLVQEDFLDSYRNLTYKGVAALKWISNYCSHAKFVLKSDDDIFVNMYTLTSHLHSFSKTGLHDKGLVLCLVWSRMKVMREGKWKVERDQFKEDYYPTYCSGSAFTLSIDAAIAMHNASYYVPFFWVDDFYVTGLLPIKAGLTHKQFSSTYLLDGRKLEEMFTGPQWYGYIFSHVHNLDMIQSVWTRLTELANGGEPPSIQYALPGQLPKVVIKPKP